MQRGEFVQAITEARRILMLPDLTPRHRAEIFRLSGRARGESGDQYGATGVLETAIGWAFKARDWDTAGMARAELGICWVEIGDIPAAIDSFQAYFLDMHRYQRAKAFEGFVHFNLALAYRRRKDHRMAIHHYQAALEWFSERGLTNYVGVVHQNVAWMYCMEGNAEAAHASLDLAGTFTGVCGPPFRVELLVGRAFAYKVQGQIGQAMALVQEVLQPGRPAVTDSHRASASWLAGTVGLAVHRLDDAWYFANSSIRYAMAANDCGIMSLASSLRAEVIRRRNILGEAAG